MKPRLFVSLLISFPVSACVFSVPYDRPDDPNAPSVFVNAPERGGFLYFENSDDCSGSVSLPGEFLANGRLIKPFPVHPDKAIAIGLVERYVEVQDDETLYVTCTAITSFVPEANKEYAVNHISAGDSCGAVAFSRAKDSDDEFVLLESAKTREPIEGMTAMSASCEPVDQ